MDEKREFPEIGFHCPRPPALARDQRSTWCNDCGKRVHNLSAMSAAEQQTLMSSKPNACISYRQKRSLIPAAVLLLAVASGQMMSTVSADEVIGQVPAEEPEQVLMGAPIAPQSEPASIIESIPPVPPDEVVVEKKQ